jgi:tRNA (pseudouridine54-N1)-methyltransferase
LFRVFILKASEGRTAPDFSLKSLSGFGRMDLIARCILAALCDAEGLRRDTTFVIVLEGPPDPPITLTLKGEEMRTAPVSEVKAAQIVLDVLSGRKVEGVKMERKEFNRVVMEYKENGFLLYYLHEGGEDSRRVKFENKTAFILGDQKGLDARSEHLLDKAKVKRVSLGPYPYLASHCIVIVNNELDKFGR